MKFSRPSLVQILFIGLAILSIGAASFFLEPINELRKEHQLTDNDPLENAPPELVMATTTLGGLRGLLINYLWLRTIKLREEGKHYEVVQLYDWICKLEPRIPEVWNHTAWDMSYNISVTMTDPQERWRWVRKGIEQIRDYGLKYNPYATELYDRLGWILLDKIGIDSMDEARFYYQKKLLQMMEPLVGRNQNLEDLVNVPQSRAELLEDPQVLKLVEAISQQGIDIFQTYFNQATLDDKHKAAIRAILTSPEHRKGYDKLIPFLRAQVLKKVYKMDPKKMLALEKKYAKLDWRLAASHSLYWAEEGIRHIDQQAASVEGSVAQKKAKNMDRLLQISLTKNFEYGYIIGQGERRLICIPNFDLVDIVHEKVYERIEKEWELEKGRVSHETFLRDVVQQGYMYNELETAKKYFKILRNKFDNPRYDKPLNEYVISEIGLKIKTMGRRHEIESFIISTLQMAYGARISGRTYRGVIRNNATEWAASLEKYSKILYKEYIKRHGDLSRTKEMEKPRSLRSMQKVAATLLKKQFMGQNKAHYGEERAEKIWQHLAKQFAPLQLADDTMGKIKTDDLLDPENTSANGEKQDPEQQSDK